MSNKERPHIVTSSEGKSREDAFDVEDTYQYFSLPVEERVKILKEKIAEREKVLFDIDTGIRMIEGNPNIDEGHDSSREPCQCGQCELRRLERLRKGILHGVKQLRVLYRELS